MFSRGCGMHQKRGCLDQRSTASRGHFKSPKLAHSVCAPSYHTRQARCWHRCWTVVVSESRNQRKSDERSRVRIDGMKETPLAVFARAIVPEAERPIGCPRQYHILSTHTFDRRQRRHATASCEYFFLPVRHRRAWRGKARHGQHANTSHRSFGRVVAQYIQGFALRGKEVQGGVEDRKCGHACTSRMGSVVWRSK